jgi:glutaminyl-tRNA synthetase
MNMRDPAIYRIRHAHHVRTGDAWCIYPMYDYTHPISDALENITHSICTLEFQDHRPFYDWLLATLSQGGFFKLPVPRQYEFSRLNLTYVVTSKRKLRQLVEENRRRLGRPAHAHHRRPAPPRLHAGSHPPVLRTHRRDQGRRLDRHEHAGRLRARRLDPKAPRATAVLRPLKLIIDNYPKARPKSAARRSTRTTRKWACAPSRSRANCGSKKRLHGSADQGLLPLLPAIGDKPVQRVRLRHGYVTECTGYDKDENGKVIAVHATTSRFQIRHPGSDNYKVKGNIHWVSAAAH